VTGLVIIVTAFSAVHYWMQQWKKY